MDLPKILIPVLAEITKCGELGKEGWYEIVYHDGNKWCHYAGSNTFDDGESVKQWKYAEECLPKESVPAETLVMPKIAEIIKETQKNIRTVYNESAKFSKNATTLKLVADHQIDLLNVVLEKIRTEFTAQQ